MFRNLCAVALATGTLAVLGVVHAAPVTIDFQSLEMVNGAGNVVGFTYDEDGYRIDNTGQPFQMLSFGTLASRYAGSTGVFNNTTNGVTRLFEQISGDPFDLLSIDVAPLLVGTDTPTTTFTGFFDGGGTIMQSFTTSGIGFVFETFNFSGFTNLAKVEWRQISPFHQFDNVVLQASTNAVVPEPASTVLFGLTALGMGLGLRRRRRNAEPAEDPQAA